MHSIRGAIAALAFLAVSAPALAQPHVQPAERESQEINTADAPAPLPRIHSVRVVTSDMARSEHFYSDVFGGRVSPIFAGEDAVQLAGGVTLIINQAAPGDEIPSRSAAGFIIQVADIEDTAQRAVAAGGELLRPPSAPSAFGARAAMLRDPDGVSIEIIEFVARN